MFTFREIPDGRPVSDDIDELWYKFGRGAEIHRSKASMDTAMTGSEKGALVAAEPFPNR